MPLWIRTLYVRMWTGHLGATSDPEQRHALPTNVVNCEWVRCRRDAAHYAKRPPPHPTHPTHTPPLTPRPHRHQSPHTHTHTHTQTPHRSVTLNRMDPWCRRNRWARLVRVSDVCVSIMHPTCQSNTTRWGVVVATRVGPNGSQWPTGSADTKGPSGSV